MFLLDMSFYFTSEVDNIYISWVAKPQMKYNYYPLHEWNKRTYLTKNIWIFFLLSTNFP